MNLKETSEFTISVIGERTGEKWFGTFKSLRRSSHRLDLQKDRIRRELLGPDAQYASDRADSQADIFSELQVSLVEAPGWWKEAGNGLDLVDDSVVREVWENVVRIKLEAINELQAKADKATVELKELAEKEA